ncbi:MAG: response regulator [Anaerolineales bacterium]|nr:response regulator [Anaerolineales bacterium]
MATKLLLIEDDVTMLALLGTLLQMEGFEIAQLESDESIERIMRTVKQEKPAAVLLDVHLRNVNGFDLLFRIRQDKSLEGTRVIMSSGIDFSARCLQEGADGFVLKPYMPEDLIHEIHRVLNLEP